MARSSTSGQGRPKGARNKKTVELQSRVSASGLTPLEFMVQVLQDEEQSFERRQWAAKEAAPYLHPRLASSEHKVTGELIAEVKWRYAGS